MPSWYTWSNKHYLYTAMIMNGSLLANSQPRWLSTLPDCRTCTIDAGSCKSPLVNHSSTTLYSVASLPQPSYSLSTVSWYTYIGRVSANGPQVGVPSIAWGQHTTEEDGSQTRLHCSSQSWWLKRTTIFDVVGMTIPSCVCMCVAPVCQLPQLLARSSRVIIPHPSRAWVRG